MLLDLGDRPGDRFRVAATSAVGFSGRRPRSISEAGAFFLRGGITVVSPWSTVVRGRIRDRDTV
jgi:hypothetical protein